MEILFATNNPAKVNRYKEKLEEKGIKVLTLKDLDFKLNIDENGKDAVENAIIKAKAYYEKTKITTIGIDDNLYIEGIPNGLQPETYVRRVNGKELNDEEMIEYYSNLVSQYSSDGKNGKLNTMWKYGLAIYDENGEKYFTWNRDGFYFVATPSEKRDVGYPLNSISIDKQTGKYFVDMVAEEKNIVFKNCDDDAINFVIQNLELKNLELRNFKSGNLELGTVLFSKYYENQIVKSIMMGLKQEKKTTLRANKLKTNIEEVKKVLDEANIKYTQVNWYKDALIIENANEEEIRNLEIYEQGKIYLQSLSSMIPPLVLNPQEGENILDMAAAPGGKTTQMAALSNNKAFITACERNKIRGEKLKYNLEKQGARKVNVLFEDSRNLDEYFSFDKILLDAPCSGSGTENVFKKNFTDVLINKSAKTQEALLKKAIKILKPGGTLIYSTCSILPIENEMIVEKALKGTNCKLVPVELSKEIPLLPSKIKEVAVVAPNELFEGFFIAKIQK